MLTLSSNAKKSIEINAEAVAILAYSARKNIPNFIPLYSVLNPPTSSGSASGKSKGALFVSANEATVKIINAIGWLN